MRKSFLKKTLMLMSVTVSLGLWLPTATASTLTDSQVSNILTAEVIGDHYGLGELTAAVIGQESSYCAQKHGIDKEGFGCGQTHLKTIKDVVGVRASPKVINHDNYFSIWLAVRVLDSCHKIYKMVPKTLYCYNHGIYAAGHVSDRRVNKDGYIRAVMKRLQEVRDVNMAIDLGS